MSEFKKFYEEVFLLEHQSRLNRYLHYLGVYLSFMVIPLAIYFSNIFLLLAYLPVHVIPGLLGHYLFERNSTIGNIRIDRRDFPIFWFILANILMAAQGLVGKLKI
jgi:hypothetical protein